LSTGKFQCEGQAALGLLPAEEDPEDDPDDEDADVDPDEEPFDDEAPEPDFEESDDEDDPEEDDSLFAGTVLVPDERLSVR
jgi:hypothetical protein